MPSAISAAKAVVSESVGWACTVSAISLISQPISIAKVASAMSSPALVPQIPMPSILPFVLSNNPFVTPSLRPMLRLRPEAAQGKTPFL